MGVGAYVTSHHARFSVLCQQGSDTIFLQKIQIHPWTIFKGILSTSKELSHRTPKPSFTRFPLHLVYCHMLIEIGPEAQSSVMGIWYHGAPKKKKSFCSGKYQDRISSPNCWVSWSCLAASSIFRATHFSQSNRCRMVWKLGSRLPLPELLSSTQNSSISKLMYSLLKEYITHH